MKRLILASSSLQRKEILAQIGLRFETVTSKVDEKLNPRLKPKGNAEQLSLLKALTVAALYTDKADTLKKKTRKTNKEGVIVLAADTFVVLDGEIIGKPDDAKQAKRTLGRLSGRMHSVISGFTIIDTFTNKTITESVETKVYFRKISLKDIDDYVRSGEPFNKAGAYGILEKGSIFIERIDGEPFNIAGLPLYAVSEALKKFGVKVL